MPLIQVKMLEEVFSPSQKKELIAKLTDAIVSVEGEHIRPVTWVLLEEVQGGHWGMGGQPMSVKDVEALAAARTR